MSNEILSILESIMIVTALSTDAFVASFAYGTNKIKIPFSSVTVINVVCSSILAVSLFFGSLVCGFIPEEITHIVCFLILFILGIVKLLDSIMEEFVKKRRGIDKSFEFSMLHMRFGINMKAEDNKLQVGQSKVLLPGEAASLAIALSLDGLAVGFGAALANSNSIQIVAFSLISDMLAVMAGCYIGNKIAEKICFNLSWLSGLLLMILAFMKL